MLTRRVRKSTELALHFRCDLCGRIQPVQIMSTDEMLELIADPFKATTAHVCEPCLNRAGDALDGADFSVWEKQNGLHD
jgi:hypothetical protein